MARELPTIPKASRYLHDGARLYEIIGETETLWFIEDVSDPSKMLRIYKSLEGFKDVIPN